MDRWSPPDYRSLMIAAVILAAMGWLGLLLLMRFTLPTVFPRWLFFFLWVSAVSGTVLPFIWLIHRRFPPAFPAPPSTLLRQSLWIGLYASLCAWLQINRSLSLALALILAVGLVVLEALMRLLERSSWRSNR
ncbi:MAG: hypothetical protein GTO14_00520 [Anaerolineales bacterium]|nr:hypothetical protein [Anaerolineales bacterium]